MPRTLGIWLAVAAAVSSAAVSRYRVADAVTRRDGGRSSATLLVFAAGLVDDLSRPAREAIRDHSGRWRPATSARGSSRCS